MQGEWAVWKQETQNMWLLSHIATCGNNDAALLVTEAAPADVVVAVPLEPGI